MSKNPSNLKIVVIGLGRSGTAVVEKLSHTEIADNIRLAVVRCKPSIADNISNNDKVIKVEYTPAPFLDGDLLAYKVKNVIKVKDKIKNLMLFKSELPHHK